MQLDKGSFCPLLKKNCVKLECTWFTQIRGYNPNTGENVDEWGCAMAWMPILMIENSQQQRSTGAAVESFRNEMVKSNDLNQQVLISAMTQPLQEIGIR